MAESDGGTESEGERESTAPFSVWDSDSSDVDDDDDDVEIIYQYLTPPRSLTQLEILFKNYNGLNVRTYEYNALPHGYSPFQRPIAEHLKYGVINIDKPHRKPAYEVTAYIKRVLKVEKAVAVHIDQLDTMASGSLVIYLGKAASLVGFQQGFKKEYVCVTMLDSPVDVSKLNSAVERSSAKVIEYDPHKNLVTFSILCDDGVCLKELSIELGRIVGAEGNLLEIRRVGSGVLDEKDNMVTLRDVLDAQWVYENHLDENYLRSVVMPLEVVMAGYRKLVVKDTAVCAICNGANLMLQGLLRFDNDIADGDEVVLWTTKGETIALGTACMTTEMMRTTDSGTVARMKRIIMDRDLYPKCWGVGSGADKKRLRPEAAIKEHMENLKQLKPTMEEKGEQKKEEDN